MCDKYFSKVKRHLKQGHLVGDDSVHVYANIFGEDSYFYMPTENRKLEEFPADSSKIKKLLDNAPEVIAKLTNNSDILKEKYKYKMLSRIELSKSNCLICGDCGKIITKNNKYDHLKNHKKNELLKCPNCGKRIKKKSLADHSKTCKPHIKP